MVFLARRSRRQQREQVDIGELDAFGDAFQLRSPSNRPTTAPASSPGTPRRWRCRPCRWRTPRRRSSPPTRSRRASPAGHRRPRRARPEAHGRAPPRAARRPGVGVSALVPAPRHRPSPDRRAEGRAHPHADGDRARRRGDEAVLRARGRGDLRRDRPDAPRRRRDRRPHARRVPPAHPHRPHFAAGRQGDRAGPARGVLRGRTGRGRHGPSGVELWPVSPSSSSTTPSPGR